MTKICETRKELGVSLDELAMVLGSGYSRARLSVLERGLRPVSEAEQLVIVAAIERISELRGLVRDVVRSASSIDLVSLCSDIRRKASDLQSAV
jgi:transcriptional regulator with XRE-family HTH domain